MEDDIDIEEHDLLNDPALRSVFPDLSIVKHEIIDFDISEETPTRTEELESKENNPCSTLEVNSGNTALVSSTQGLDVKPDIQCTDTGDTLTDAHNTSPEFENVDIYIKKESDNFVSELPFYRNRIILGKINADVSDRDPYYIINTKPSNYSDLAVRINFEAGRSKISNKCFEKCLRAKIIVTNCYSTLLSNNCYCAQCAVLFPTTEAYSEHYTSTHTDATNSTNPFECEICQKIFRLKKTFNRHVTSHTAGRKLFKCDFCNKLFTQKGNLIRHMFTHTGKKRPFECEICKKTFLQSNHLKQHMLIHTGEKPLACETCKKRFTSISNLNAHKLIHTGERPFECVTCKKTFNRRGNLNCHIKLLHEGQMPFECKICQKSFKYRSYLSQHQLTHW